MRRLAPLCSLMILLLAAPALAVSTNAKQAIVLDLSSDTVLYAKEADSPMTPSSMSKLMTLYVVYDLMKQGRITPEDTFEVSEKAWRMGGSKMFVHVGHQVKVDDLLKGVIVQSGNDACVVLAEGISGTEEGFADEMNRMAKKMGLKGSHFVNSHGFPDEQHYMTAHDLAILSERLIEDFPEYYPLFAEKTYTYNNITQQNRNILLGGPLNVDGLKTGHTEAGGYGISISAESEGRRLVVVVNGLSSMKERADEADKLLKWGFHQFDLMELATPGKRLAEADVWMGTKRKVGLTVEQPVKMTIARSRRDEVKMLVRYTGPLQAPLAKAQPVAELVIRQPEMPDRIVPLVTTDAVEELTGIKRIFPALKQLWQQRQDEKAAEEQVATPAHAAEAKPAAEKPAESAKP